MDAETTRSEEILGASSMSQPLFLSTPKFCAARLLMPLSHPSAIAVRRCHGPPNRHLLECQSQLSRGTAGRSDISGRTHSTEKSNRIHDSKGLMRAGPHNHACDPLRAELNMSLSLVSSFPVSPARVATISFCPAWLPVYIRRRASRSQAAHALRLMLTRHDYRTADLLPLAASGSSPDL